MSVLLEKILSIVLSLMLVVLLVIPIYNYTLNVITYVDRKSQFDEISQTIELAINESINSIKNVTVDELRISINLTIYAVNKTLIIQYYDNMTKTMFERTSTYSCYLIVLGYSGSGIYSLVVHYFVNKTQVVLTFEKSL